MEHEIMWSATDLGSDVVRELECSRDGTGTAQAQITIRPWTVAKRFEYESRLQSEGVTFEDDDMQGRLKRVDPSVISRLMIELSVVSWEGFEEGADLRSADYLNRVAESVYEEILTHVTSVQPIPGTKAKRPQDHRAKAEADAEDPSRTPRTGRVEDPAA